MNIFQALVYGIVQGITEFLPVSSTAHLDLLPWIVGWKEPGNVFDVALHFGTALAVVVFFFKDWVRLISAGLAQPRSQFGKLFWSLVIATMLGAVAGVLLDKYMNNFNPLLTGILLIVMGAVLYVCDKIGKSRVGLENMGIGRSVIVGVAQVLAIIPGVSRSGITMSVGRATGVDRAGIAKFTFLLSTPIILGDAVFHAKDLPGVPIDITLYRRRSDCYRSRDAGHQISARLSENSKLFDFFRLSVFVWCICHCIVPDTVKISLNLSWFTGKKQERKNELNVLS